jgi:prevent-host-death family protein
MKRVLISEFKAKCIAVLREAQRTGEPVLITRRGRPIARIEPFAEGQPRRRLGALRGRMRIKGDIVRVDTTQDWETPR